MNTQEKLDKVCEAVEGKLLRVTCSVGAVAYFRVPAGCRRIKGQGSWCEYAPDNCQRIGDNSFQLWEAPEGVFISCVPGPSPHTFNACVAARDCEVMS